MNSFDPELVAALADGTLEATEAAALEARIAADPAASADLADQRAALAAIRGAGAPLLSDHERVFLRATVAAQLGLSPDAAPVAVSARRRRPAWGAIAVAASTLVAVAAFAPMLGQLLDRETDNGGPLSAEAVTTLAEQDDFGTPLLGTPNPTALPEASDATVAGAADGFATTDPVVAATERALNQPTVADDLALLKGDPVALAQLEQPVGPATACLTEAAGLLGTADLTTFEYLTYVVFRLPAPDGVGPGTLVAFDPADCTTPIAVP
jgi:hypothetical protein